MQWKFQVDIHNKDTKIALSEHYLRMKGNHGDVEPCSRCDRTDGNFVRKLGKRFPRRKSIKIGVRSVPLIQNLINKLPEEQLKSNHAAKYSSKHSVFQKTLSKFARKICFSLSHKKRYLVQIRLQLNNFIEFDMHCVRH